MGRAGKWLRSFLPGRRGKAGAADPADLALALPGATTTTPASTPGAKEKRRWSFRRPAAASPAKDAQGGRLAHYGSLEPRVLDPDRAAPALELALLHRPPTPPRRRRRGARRGPLHGGGVTVLDREEGGSPRRSLDSSRDLQFIFVIQFIFRLYLVHHASDL